MREVTLELEVEEPAVSERRLLALAASERWAVERGRRLALRVPGEALARAVELVSALGTMASRAESARDASRELAELEATARALEGARARSMARARADDDPQRARAVELALSDLDRRLEDVRTRRERLQVQTSSVLLQVRLERRTSIEIERLARPELPVAWLKHLGLPELRTLDARTTPGKVTALVEGSIGVKTWYAADLPNDRADSWAALASAQARAYAAARRLGVATAFNAALGGGKGLAYELGWTVGPGVSLCSRSVLALTTGLGARAWSGNRLRAGLEIPLELWSETRLGRTGLLSLTASPRWVPWVHVRHRGSALTRFADELSLGARMGLALGDGIEQGALYLGYTYGEIAGTRMHEMALSFGAGVTESEGGSPHRR